MAGFGHIAVGLAAARVLSNRPGVRSGFAASAVGLVALSMAPDLDVLAFAFGIPYESVFGHRGASHALVTAALVAGIFVALPWRAGASRGLVFGVVFAAVASHGVLDSLTDGGKGIALLWPATEARYFAPWRPIPVSPTGAGLVSERGMYVVGFEVVTFAPLWLWALWPRRDPTMR